MADVATAVPVFTADSALVDRVLPSPNYRTRNAGERLEFVIIHGTWMAGDDGALQRLCDPVAEVSCHYYITREGEVIQLVPERLVAFHAGVSRAVKSDGAEVNGLNNWSLGIEVANCGPFLDGPPSVEQETLVGWTRAEPYTEAQYLALKELVADILARNPHITSERVLGHNEVAPGRKTDPGVHFSWDWLR
ncbi:MAG: N-acetylmuramoyl-L-alanine amidase [Blastochloris viridis]|uniref:N-acetylmuramoyl-L-alanine amidase n=1 Tax=Blastochloris viridis TaxID=1079 RepID=A0A6N4RBS3_BLAVI|nr:MAG: N-acetylmuramoyl-L-alanine amidase [Blastochloris viridis]